jgi:enterochelin esterase-like enzyme
VGNGHIHPVPTIAPSIIRQVGARGWLENPLLAVVLLVLAFTVTVAWIALGVRARRSERPHRSRTTRWVIRGGAGLAVFTLLVASGAAAVNAYVGYVPDLGGGGSGGLGRTLMAGGQTVTLGGASGSRVVLVRIGAPALGLPRLPAYVYLPPGYLAPGNAYRRYPTVYLIHGHPGGPRDWFRAGRVQRTMDILIAHRVVGPMIVVSPAASPSWLLDTECLNKPNAEQMETYLAITVPDSIDHWFRTLPSRSNRAIGGMSSGAFCALNIGLHHLHRFSVILVSEPFGTPGGIADRKMLLNDPALTWANSPSDYLPNLRFSLPTATFLDAGGRDRRTLSNLHTLAELLARHGQEVGYRIAAQGNHTWLTARVELPYALLFAWNHFGKLADGGSDRADFEREQALVSFAHAHGLTGVTTPPTPGVPAQTTATPVPAAGAGSATARTSPRRTPRSDGPPHRSAPPATATP